MTFELIALALVALAQPAGRRASACVFAGCALSFDLLCYKLPGESYFLAAAATDAVCIVLLAKIPGSGLLSRFCLVSITLNFAGWSAYELDLPSYPYELSFIFYYMAAILALIIRGLTDGDDTYSGYFSRFHLYSGSSNRSR